MPRKTTFSFLLAILVLFHLIFPSLFQKSVVLVTSFYPHFHERNRRIQGFWFLPDKPDQKVAGVFTYSRADGCKLEVVDELRSTLFGDRRIPIINGIGEDGTSITLVLGQRLSGRRNFKGVQTAVLRIQFAFLGKHYSSEEDIQFDKLQASLSDLGKWLEVYGFSKLDTERKERFSIELSYRVPDNISCPVDEHMKVEFEFDAAYTMFKETNDAEVHQRSFAVIKTSAPRSYNDLFAPFYTLYKFFSLSYYDAPPLLSLFFVHTGEKHEDDENYSLTVEVLYQDNFYNAQYKEKLTHNFLIDYQEIKDIFPEVMIKWFTLFGKLSPSVNLLNELLLQRGRVIEISFLTAIQAVETFHRNIYGGEATPRGEHDKRMASIVAGTPEEYRPWLKEKLAFSNEPTLRNRLTDLLDRVPEKVISPLIKDKDEFIAMVVHTRNYYTHYSPQLKAKGKVMDHTNQFGAVQRLKIILIASILQQLGFTEEQVTRAMKMHIVYPYFD